MIFFSFFFFQAEDGIRDIGVTGVQTCALPIYRWRGRGRHSGEERWGLPGEEPALPRHLRPDGRLRGDEWGAGTIVPAALMKRCQAVVGLYLPQIMTRPEIFPEPAGDPRLDLLR